MAWSPAFPGRWLKGLRLSNLTLSSMPCSINPFRAFSTHRIAERGESAQECTRARARGFLENHFEKGLGADEAAPSNCKLEGHASSCPKLQARRAVHQGRRG